VTMVPLMTDDTWPRNDHRKGLNLSSVINGTIRGSWKGLNLSSVINGTIRGCHQRHHSWDTIRGFCMQKALRQVKLKGLLG